MAPKKFYHDDPAWSDVEPIPQDDGGPYPLAAIAYTDEYREAMSYLRAVMAKNEASQRVLALTEHIISMNPAHYTVWLYRAKTLSALSVPLSEEIAWLNPTALRHIKNYQIWHHRQTIINQLGSPKGESDFITSMLAQDSKNYHVWSYRQWLVQRFNIYTDEELAWTESMIDEDIRNNSAWNHRFFLVFGKSKDAIPSQEIIDRELDYAKSAIRKAPQNQSPWNYLRGAVRHVKLPVSTLKQFALEFADTEKPDEVFSSHALDVLADVYAEEKGMEEQARRALELLAERYDPIRKQYWNYRMGLLGEGRVV
ncbi:CaaX farnesyltransferase alpha subunit [Polyplosphaeria fusca]|uniref:Protein farnesyltransferase/geranylgeranyltransferase type-1 subunit alpha n=1 Tax=Polyplosphaeria fusca TaxID=682080 RepID=A0A9P4QT26_9PLEO|nr:CaaX farnesyltransferase alpha subunit [Polyplosphaeria fusca]